MRGQKKKGQCQNVSPKSPISTQYHTNYNDENIAPHIYANYMSEITETNL